MMLSIDQIRREVGLQARVQIDAATVERYAEDLRAGERLPPVVVFWDGETYWLADGWHRIEAAIRRGKTSIEAEVLVGGERDALLYAVRANATHGKPRTDQDKRRAVSMLLGREEWAGASTAWLASAARVSDHLVALVRDEVQPGWRERGLNGRDGRRRSSTRCQPPAREVGKLTGPSADGLSFSGEAISNPTLASGELALPANVFAIGNIAATADRKAREVLRSIRIERAEDGASFAVATDGKMMLVATWQDKLDCPLEAGVPLEAWKEAATLSRKGRVTLSVEGERLTLQGVVGGATRRLECQSVRWIRWRPILESVQQAGELTSKLNLAGRRLGVLASTIAAIVGDSRLEMEARTEAVLLRADDDKFQVQAVLATG